MQVHKGRFIFQLKDKETGEIEIHELDYVSKDAENLVVKQSSDRKTAFTLP